MSVWCATAGDEWRVKCDVCVQLQVMKIENDIDVIAFMVRRLSPVHKYLFIAGGTGAGPSLLRLLSLCGLRVQF
eukprot:1976540-Rhodomonas_salina.1